nr:FAD/NAD(P)-binding protein [Lacticaseibacillus camelliae]
MKIALIGAGPRGLLVLERLSAWQQGSQGPLNVTLYDPFPIGGRVWRRDQDPHLIMNTAAQHITLFYDRTVEDPGPVNSGPDLAQWPSARPKRTLRALAAQTRQPLPRQPRAWARTIIHHAACTATTWPGFTTS